MTKPTPLTLDPAGTRLLREFKHDAPLMSCIIDPTGRWCFAGGRARKLYLTDINVGDVHELDAHESWVVASARWSNGNVSSVVPMKEPLPPPLRRRRFESTVSPPSKHAADQPIKSLVATGDHVGGLVVWETSGEQPRQVWSVDTKHETLRTVSVSFDGQIIATGGGDGVVRLWSASHGVLVRELLGHKCPVFSGEFHPDGKHLVTGDRGDQKIKQWEIASGKQVREFDAEDLSNYKGGTGINYGGVRDLDFNADGSVMFCCGRDSYAKPGLILQFDWKTGQQIRKQVSTFASSIFHHVATHQDGFIVAAGVGAQTGEIWFWNPEQDEKLANIKVAGPAYGMSLHPDGRHIAVAQMTGPTTYGDSGVVGLYEIPFSNKLNKT